MFVNYNNARLFSYFIICPLSSHDQSQGERSLPIAVSLVGPRVIGHQYGNVVKIQNRQYVGRMKQLDLDLKEQNKFGVCIKPIHSNFSSPQSIIEFIELYKILGVSHFTFYSVSVSRQTSCLLQKYIDQGTVQVLPWNLEFSGRTHIDVRLVLTKI